MGETDDEKVIRMYREALVAEAYPTDLSVTFRISGGMPSERVEQQLTVTGSNDAKTSRFNMLESDETQTGSGMLSQGEVDNVLNSLDASVDTMVTRENARFLPDSLVGSVTIEIEGEQVTLYFPVDEEEISRGDTRLAQTQQLVDSISQRLLTNGALSHE